MSYYSVLPNVLSRYLYDDSDSLKYMSYYSVLPNVLSIYLYDDSDSLKYIRDDIIRTNELYSKYRTIQNREQFSISKVIFNGPATIVLWSDGTKTIVKCSPNDNYDPEKALAMCIAKKALGNSGRYYNTIKNNLPKTSKNETKINE